MKDFKIVYLFNAILRAVAFVCITVAAIHFNKAALLWFYIVPLFMGVQYTNGGESEDEV